MFTKNKLAVPILAVVSFGAIGETPTKQDGELIEEVEVLGIRSSLRAAADLKKNSSVIQDSIVMEDMGKFPDQNVAESLQRISGVSIDRTRGEGSQITVRGFGPAFNEVTINGRTLATTSRGREFDFQVMAPELIAGADVYKTPMGKIPSGSIGAYVDINTARPLDNVGQHIALSTELKRNDLSGENDPKFSGIYSDTFANDTVGILLGVSRQSSSNRIDSTSASHWSTIPDPAGIIDGDIKNTRGGIVTPSELIYAGRHQFSIYQEERERDAVNVTLQWAPSTTFTNTLDLMYSEFGNTAVRQGLQIPLQRAGWKDVIVSDNNTVLAATKYHQQDPGNPLDGKFGLSGMTSETFAAGFNSKAEFDDWTLNFDLSLSRADATTSNDDLVPLYINGQGSVTAIEDGTDQLNEFTYDIRNNSINFTSTADFSDPDNARASWNWVDRKELKDEVKQFRFDANRNISRGVLESIDTGLSYGDRTKSKDAYRHPDGCKNKDVSWTDPDLALYNTCGTFREMSGVFTASSYNDFLSGESGNFPKTFVLVRDIDTYHAGVRQLRQDTWPQLHLSEESSVRTTEETASAYTQFNLSGPLGDYSWYGNVGLRYTNTKTASTGYRKDRLTITPVVIGVQPMVEVTYTESRPVTVEKDYSHFLPSANFALDFGNGFFIRSAASKVITNPQIEDIGVDRYYSAGHAGQFSRGGGNPYLEPYEVKQFDLSLEYYQDNGNTFAINAFQKNIENFISTIVSRDESPDIFVNGQYQDSTVDVPNFGNLVETITQKENRPGGSIIGVELAGLYHFDYLPGFWSGFGIQANYTRLKSEDSGAEKLDRANVQEPGSAIEGFAEDSYNFILFYDKYDVQFRAAYNWRGDYLSRRFDDGLPRHVKDYGQLDLRASYDINEKLTVSASAVNVTNETVSHYGDIEERMRLIEYSGPRYMVGLSAKF